jgi:hypothetical protein
MFKIPLIFVFASALTTPLMVSLEPSAISETAKESIVRVNGQNPGSGVIYKKEGNSYYVLTAKHVVATPDEYEIITDDEQVHPLDFANVFPVPDTDLAIAEFTSDQSYQPVELGNSDQITEGDDVFIAGWPHAGEAIPYIYQFITGNISGLPARLLPDGYGLIYTSTARQGMSGGPLFDDNGSVVGIHGRAEGKEIYLPDADFDSTTVRDGFSLGVPINVFLDKTIDPQPGADAEPPVTTVAPEVAPEVEPAVRESVINRRSANTDRFAQPLVLARDVSIPVNRQFRESEYLFTIDIPADAGAPLQQIVFQQIEGAGYPGFSTRETHAYEGGDRNAEIPLNLVSNDTDKKIVTVVFDPPVEPGRQITVALKAHRNPRDGTYLFEAKAYPPGENSLPQRLGTRQLRFYEADTL